MRSCGDCIACCTALTIEELGKPAGVACENLTPEGCGIYETRPQVCRDFSCLWASGSFNWKGRPDRSGVMAHAQKTAKGVVGVLDELRPGALVGLRGKVVAAGVARTLPTLVRRADGSGAVVGPPAALARMVLDVDS